MDANELNPAAITKASFNQSMTGCIFFHRYRGVLLHREDSHDLGGSTELIFHTLDIGPKINIK